MRRGLAALVLLALGLAGAAAGLAFTGETTGTVTAAVPDQVITIPGTTNVQTYTIPTVTETVTVTSPADTAPTTTAAPPPPPPPPPPTYGGRAALGLLRYAGGLPNTSNLSEYRAIITDHNLSEDQLAAQQPGLSLEYANGMAVSSTQDDGVPIATARSNGWILKRADGSEFCNSAKTLCLVDTGNAAYQQNFALNVAGYVASISGLDGVFIDNVSADYHEFNYSGTPINPSTGQSLTTAEWQAKQLSFHSYVNTYLRSFGIYIAGNAGAFSPGDVRSNDGSLTVWWWNYLVDSTGKSLFDGLFDEHWMFAGGHPRLVGSAWDNNWVKYADLVNTAQSLGADFQGEDIGSTAQVIRYGRGTLLLNWDCGDGVYIFNSSGDPWTYGSNADLGCPTGPKRQIATNVWRRDFDRGYVVVNPTSAASSGVPSGDAQITLTG